MPTTIFIDILAGILIIIGVIFLMTALKRDFLPNEIRGKKISIPAKVKRMHLVFIGFSLLLLSVALLLLT